MIEIPEEIKLRFQTALQRDDRDLIEKMRIKDKRSKSHRSRHTFRKRQNRRKDEAQGGRKEQRAELKNILEQENNDIYKQIENLRCYYSEYSTKIIRLKDIDKTFKKILCVKKISETVRLLLLSESTFQEYERGEVIFREGDFIRDMFFVIKGSISLKKGKEEVVINRIYEGMNFGQFSIVDDILDKKSCSIFVSKLIDKFDISPLNQEERKLFKGLASKRRINCRNQKAVAETYTAVIKVPVNFFLRCKNFIFFFSAILKIF